MIIADALAPLWFHRVLQQINAAFQAIRPDNAVKITGGTISGVTTLSATQAVTAASGTAIPAGGASTVGFVATATASFGVFFGSGAPTLSAAKGSLYLRSDGSSTSTRAYINTDGGTTWTSVTTAA
jgi:hypothetical protein